jgi:uncharacterized integral membrane protein
MIPTIDYLPTEAKLPFLVGIFATIVVSMLMGWFIGYIHAKGLLTKPQPKPKEKE